MSAAVILQARMGSRRLPGKVLADVAGRTVLAHCILRLQTSGLPVIVATTTGREDELVAREAEAYGAGVFRGDAEDVLGRYVAAALANGVTEVVRATADNPAVDIDAPGRVLALQHRTHVDHVIESGLPIGAAVEAVLTSALVRAGASATESYDREHVTPFVRRGAGFTTLSVMAPARLRHPSLRLTIDTDDDLQRMRAVLESFRGVTPPASLEAIIFQTIRAGESVQPADTSGPAWADHHRQISTVKEVGHASAR